MWSHQLILSLLLTSILLWPGLECEEVDQEKEGGGGPLARVFGLPGVWWPHTHIFANGWSALAAALSSAVVGASLLPASRRSQTSRATERVFRGVVAQPHSWPWIAKLKVRARAGPEREGRNSPLFRPHSDVPGLASDGGPVVELS